MIDRKIFCKYLYNHNMIVIEETQEWIPNSIISPVCHGNIIPEVEFPF